MRPPCEAIVTIILPAVRSLLAQELINHQGFSQIEVARLLGTTQPAISQYLSQKRGDQLTNLLESSSVVRLAIRRASKRILESPFSSVDGIRIFCELCSVLKQQDVVCKLHRETVGLPQSCQLCFE